MVISVIRSWCSLLTKATVWIRVIVIYLFPTKMYMMFSGIQVGKDDVNTAAVLVMIMVNMVVPQCLLPLIACTNTSWLQIYFGLTTTAMKLLHWHHFLPFLPSYSLNLPLISVFPFSLWDSNKMKCAWLMQYFSRKLYDGKQKRRWWQQKCFQYEKTMISRNWRFWNGPS